MSFCIDCTRYIQKFSQQRNSPAKHKTTIKFQKNRKGITYLVHYRYHSSVKPRVLSPRGTSLERNTLNRHTPCRTTSINTCCLVYLPVRPSRCRPCFFSGVPTTTTTRNDAKDPPTQTKQLRLNHRPNRTLAGRTAVHL